MTKAPQGGGKKTGPNPTDRGKRGTKRSVLVDAHGIPLGIVHAGANCPDMALLAETLDAVVAPRPQPSAVAPQHWCLDKGYDSLFCGETVRVYGYAPHIRSRGEEHGERVQDPEARPHRWMVEVCHSWLNRFRKLLVRFDELEVTRLALLHFVCAYVVFKRAKLF